MAANNSSTRGFVIFPLELDMSLESAGLELA